MVEEGERLRGIFSEKFKAAGSSGVKRHGGQRTDPPW
jgi:hypothetical protein